MIKNDILKYGIIVLILKSGFITRTMDLPIKTYESLGRNTNEWQSRANNESVILFENAHFNTNINQLIATAENITTNQKKELIAQLDVGEKIKIARYYHIAYLLNNIQDIITQEVGVKNHIKREYRWPTLVGKNVSYFLNIYKETVLSIWARTHNETLYKNNWSDRLSLVSND